MLAKIDSPKVPKLRFPGFVGSWQVKTLESLLSEKIDNRGKTPPVSSVGIPLLEVNSIGEKLVDYSSVSKYVSEETYNSWFRDYIQTKDILFSTVGQTALCSLYEGEKKAAIAQNLVGLRFNVDDPDFVFYLFTEPRNNNKFKRIEMVAVQPSVKVSQMVGIGFLLPSKPEQQKIATFLSKIDEWIENLKKQKREWEKYKKGMMQKIFSQKIRFKDENGEEFPKWKDGSLSETGQIITGTTPSTSNKSYYGTEYPWITPTDIDDEKDIFTSSRYLSSVGLEVGRKVPKNSLLVTCIASIGKNAILRTDGSCNQQINAITPNSSHNVDFLYYLIVYYKNKLIRMAGAGGMQMLNKKDFSELFFNIPILAEQQKIAEFLSSLDKAIESKQKQISLVENWKKGLMQRMFV